jgi:dihydrofolate reductase
MGKIVISENITLDGVIEDPTGENGTKRGGWFGQIGDQDRAEWAKAELEEAAGAEALLMGRRYYEYFVARGWESRTGAWADRLRALPKYVVSSTLEDLEWSNSTVLRGEVVAEVSKLKERIDGEIVVYASGRLVPTLIDHDLVDELRLMTFPFIVGAGQRLFAETSELKSLRLAGTRSIGAGIVLLTYQLDSGH